MSTQVLITLWIAGAWYKKWKCAYLKESPRWRLTVTSPLNEIFTDHLGNGVGVKQTSGQIFKADVNVCPPPRIFASWVNSINEESRLIFSLKYQPEPVFVNV